MKPQTVLELLGHYAYLENLILLGGWGVIFYMYNADIPKPKYPCYLKVVNKFVEVVGGWGKAENKAKLSPAGAGSWAELGKIGNLWFLT